MNSEKLVLNRRHFLTMLGLTGTLTAMGITNLNPIEVAKDPAKAPAALGAIATPQAGKVSSDEALKMLLDGNKRFVEGKQIHPHVGKEARDAAAKGQAPFAAIIGCSDSRVTPEILFDQGIGDIFTARTAGNIADDVVIGSIEYAVAVLGASLIMVLGHERCGAVVAAVEGKPLPGRIGVLADRIKPAADKAKAGQDVKDVVDLAVRENVKMTVQMLSQESEIFAAAIKAGKLKIVGARYDLDEVKVELL
jgi:carbonic anhydrase